MSSAKDYNFGLINFLTESPTGQKFEILQDSIPVRISVETGAELNFGRSL
jgi:hypothetical protein